MPEPGPGALLEDSCLRMSCSAIASTSSGNNPYVNRGAFRSLFHVSDFKPGLTCSRYESRLRRTKLASWTKKLSAKCWKAVPRATDTLE